MDRLQDTGTANTLESGYVPQRAQNTGPSASGDVCVHLTPGPAALGGDLTSNMLLEVLVTRSSRGSI